MKTCAWCRRTGTHGYVASRGHVVCSARKACLHLVDGIWLRLFVLEESAPGAHLNSIATSFPRRVV